MKIAIITFQRAHNYGAVLQAHSLRKYLETLGHDVSIIDYWPKYRRGMYSIFNFRIFKKDNGLCKGLFKLVGRNVRALLTLKTRIKRKRSFDNFIENYVLKKKSYPSETFNFTDSFELYIYGSDQIWRYNKFPGTEGFDLVYWGNGDSIDHHKKITYAASMGLIKDDIDSINFIKNNINNFKSISVREKTLKDLIENNLDVNVIKVLDPVFLMPKEYWCNLINNTYKIPDKYVVLYNINENPIARLQAENYARSRNIEIVEIVGGVKLQSLNKRYRADAGPSEFLRIISNAEFVFSTSFHGVAFALIFEKPFLSMGMGKNCDRVISLLSDLGIRERYVDSTDIKFNFEKIDYSLINKRLLGLIDDSKTYLINNLE